MLEQLQGNPLAAFDIQLLLALVIGRFDFSHGIRGLAAADGLPAGSNGLVLPRIGRLVEIAEAHARFRFILMDGGGSTTRTQVLGLAKPVGVCGTGGTAHTINLF